VIELDRHGVKDSRCSRESKAGWFSERWCGIDRFPAHL